MRSWRLTFAAGAVTTGLLVVLIPQRAPAIPAWARAYQVSCTACHAPFPNLKAFGEEFARRGYRMDGAALPALDVGDSLLQLPREIPIAVRMEGYASWKEKATGRTDVEYPWVFKIISGGAVGRTVSYYVYFLTERGAVVGLEDAWVQISGLAGLPLDVQVGQFQVADPMFKRELRLERFDYDILATRVGLARVDLTYDRGLLATWHAPRNVDAILTVVNGSGIEAADAKENFDSDRFKNVGLRLVHGSGGVRLGVFGYLGRERGAAGRTNRTTYIGPDLVAELGPRFKFSAEYLERRDDDPRFEGRGGPDLVTRGGLAEVLFFPQDADGRWVLAALYNKVDSDAAESRSENASLTVSYLLARNARLLLDGGRDLQSERTRVSLGLVTAF